VDLLSLNTTATLRAGTEFCHTSRLFHQPLYLFSLLNCAHV
jgi:hypothetical protein